MFDLFGDELGRHRPDFRVSRSRQRRRMELVSGALRVERTISP
jgi:hypothetical protein